MKTYIDVLIVWKHKDSSTFILALKEFGAQMSGWEFLEQQSKEYSSATGEPSCALLKADNTFKPAVAITIKTGSTFYIANIVPKETGRLSMTEYNEVARQFAKDIKQYAKERKLKLEVKTTHENIGLSDIIRGNKTRELFERYLNQFPLSYHPLDIERLDAFICAGFRYSKGKIDLDLLKGWVIEEKKWSEKDASWCVERISPDGHLFYSTYGHLLCPHLFCHLRGMKKRIG